MGSRHPQVKETARKKERGRSHDGEVPAVQGGDLARAPAARQLLLLRRPRSESEIRLSLDELGGALEVGAANVFDGELSRDEASQNSASTLVRAPAARKVGHLRDHEVQDDQRLSNLFEPGDALAMVRIIAKSGRDQRSGVDDDRAQTNPSASSLSSACLAEKPGLAWPMPMKPTGWSSTQ